MPFKSYRQLAPAVPIQLPGGRIINFKTADQLSYYFGTGDEVLQQQIESLMRENVGGITEVPEKEFVEQYLQKKNQPSPQLKTPWREEFGLAGTKSASKPLLEQVGAAEVNRVVAVQGSDPDKKAAVTSATVADIPKADAKKEPEPFTPTVGKRKSVKKVK